MKPNGTVENRVGCPIESMKRSSKNSIEDYNQSSQISSWQIEVTTLA